MVCATSLNACSETITSGICGGGLQKREVNWDFLTYHPFIYPVRCSYRNLDAMVMQTCQREAQLSTKWRAEASQAAQCGKGALLCCTPPRRTGTRPMLPLRGCLLTSFCSSIAGRQKLQIQKTSEIIEPIQSGSGTSSAWNAAETREFSEKYYCY